jgi:branched-chain amino acid transport system permease protein
MANRRRDVARFVRTSPVLAVVAVLAALLVLFLVQDIAVRLDSGDLVVGDVVSRVWNGSILGMAIGLAGIGLALTYSILRFANFAHGDLMTAGAFVGWITTFLVAGLGQFPLEALVHVGGPFTINTNTLGVSVTNTPVAIALGLLVAIAFTAVLALGIDRLVFKPMREASGIALLIASVGVALALRYLIVFTLQAQNRGLTAGQLTPGWTIEVGGASIQVNGHQLTLILLAGLLMVATHLLLRHTKLGTAMRAMADNEDLARITGIPTERVVTATWLLGGGLTGASGYLIALWQGTLSTTLGWGLLLLIFAAVILGGIGSPYGAIVGGLVIGIASRLSLVWIDSSFILVAAFLVMIIMLLFRPSGLLGGVTTA